MTGLPCRIYEESWKSAYRGIVPQDYLDHISAGGWAEILDQADWDTLVSVEEGRFIGTASVCPSRWRDWAESGELVSLYLLPEYMGRGYGRLLLEAAVKLLAKHGFQDVLLWVLEDNHKARRFYETAGFAASGDFMEDEIGGKPLRETLYRRSVKG